MALVFLMDNTTKLPFKNTLFGLGYNLVRLKKQFKRTF